MNNFEIILAFIGNLRGFFIGGLILMGFGLLFWPLFPVGSLYESVDSRKKFLHIKKYIWVPVLFGLLACIPNVEDLWRVRLALLKLELASPENVQKSSEAITEIAKKLECKYLGCETK